MCKEIGISNSHIFFEKCFLIVEGESEYNFFPIVYKHIFNSTLGEDGITLINLKGNGSALNFLKLLVENKEEKIILAVDSDSVNINKKSVISNLKNKLDTKQADRFFDNNIMFIGDKEFEDCFTNDYIALVLNRSLHKKNNEDLWMPYDIEDHRKSEKFSDSIVNMVNKYMSSNSRFDFINKPILGKLLAENINIEDIPLDINNVIYKIRQVSGVDEYKYEENFFNM
nr:TOPRIM nucleotidyl transferase/hydrolase domain-containing protein [Paeniclostridium sordellii]